MIFDNRMTPYVPISILSNWKERGYTQRFERSKLVGRNINAKELIWKG